MKSNLGIVLAVSPVILLLPSDPSLAGVDEDRRRLPLDPGAGLDAVSGAVPVVHDCRIASRISLPSSAPDFPFHVQVCRGSPGTGGFQIGMS